EAGMFAERAEREPHIAADAVEAGRPRRPAAHFLADEPRCLLRRHAAGDELAVAILEVLLDLVVELVAGSLTPAHSRFSTAIGSIAMARCAGRYVAMPLHTATTPSTVA